MSFLSSIRFGQFQKHSERKEFGKTWVGGTVFPAISKETISARGSSSYSWLHVVREILGRTFLAPLTSEI